MSPESRAILKATLVADEGLRLHPYIDTVGKTSIGIGRNLTDVGISSEEADYLCASDISRAIRLLDSRRPEWATLDDVRQRVLVNMAFNLGGRVFGFRKMWAALVKRDFETAAAEMLDSRWAQQVGARANRLALAMITGVEP